METDGKGSPGSGRQLWNFEIKWIQQFHSVLQTIL